MHAGIPPPLEGDPPGADTPWKQTSPPGADLPWEQTPQKQTPPQEQTPPRSTACWDIQATSGRYASYWNAFLFLLTKFVIPVEMYINEL